MKNGIVSWIENLKWKNLNRMKLKLKCVMQTVNEMKAEKVASTKIVGVVALSQRQGLNGKTVLSSKRLTYCLKAKLPERQCVKNEKILQ